MGEIERLREELRATLTPMASDAGIAHADAKLTVYTEAIRRDERIKMPCSERGRYGVVEDHGVVRGRTCQEWRDQYPVGSPAWESRQNTPMCLSCTARAPVVSTGTGNETARFHGCKCPDGWPRKRPLMAVPEEWWDGRVIVLPQIRKGTAVTPSGWWIITHTGECELRDEVVRG